MVTVEDGDGGSGGRTSCNLTDGRRDFRLSAVPELAADGDDGTSVYLVSTARRLDREEQRGTAAGELTLTVACHDGGRPPLSSEASFTVAVLDLNDNAPRFAHSAYSVR